MADMKRPLWYWRQGLILGFALGVALTAAALHATHLLAQVIDPAISLSTFRLAVIAGGFIAAGGALYAVAGEDLDRWPDES